MFARIPAAWETETVRYSPTICTNNSLNVAPLVAGHHRKRVHYVRLVSSTNIGRLSTLSM